MLRVITTFTGLPGSPWYNVMHFGGTDASEAELAEGKAEAFWQSVANSISSEVDMEGSPVVYQIDPATGMTTEAYTTPGWTYSGANAGDPAPLAAQGLITTYSATYTNGRRAIGKIFIPGTTDDVWTDGVVTPANATVWQASADALVGDGTTSGYRIWSRANGSEEFPTTAVIPPRGAILRSRRD